MRTNRGFTLIELAVVVAIIGVLAATGVLMFRSAGANANLGASTAELVLRLGSQRAEALADGRERIVVIVDARNNDGTLCGRFSTADCARFFVLRDPPAGWTLNGFLPNAPTAIGGQLEHQQPMARGVQLYLPGAGETARPPFTAVPILDPELLGACDGRRCVAIRFGGDGTVEPVPPAPGVSKTAVAVVFATATAQLRAGERRGLVVGFPTGFVRAFPY